MSIEDYKRQREVMEMQAQGKFSPVMRTTEPGVCVVCREDVNDRNCFRQMEVIVV